MPIEYWHAYLGKPTPPARIRYCIAHAAHKLDLYLGEFDANEGNGMRSRLLYGLPTASRPAAYDARRRPAANKPMPSPETTTSEATELLRKDISIAERAVLRLISVPLTDGQFDALVSFTFNLGAGALQRSTLRRKVNRAEHEGVPTELMKWVWAAGKRLPGLVRRRLAEGSTYASASGIRALMRAGNDDAMPTG